MAELLNRARMVTRTTGQGTITLGPGITGFATFAEAGAADGSTYSYVIEEGDDWEIGTGTYASGAVTLTRTVTKSKINGSIGTTKMTLLGSAVVSCAARAEDILTTAQLVDGASSAEFIANTVDKTLLTQSMWESGAFVSLTDAATIALDMATFINATVTLGGNRALGNPTNPKVGQTGIIEIVQDGTGSRTLSYGSNWEFVGGSVPTLSAPANSSDTLIYTVRSSTRILASLMKGWA
jgi:hypothetical protein